MAVVLLKCVRAHQKTGSFALTSALLLASGYLQQLKTVVNGLFLSSVSNPGAALADLDAGAAGVPLVRALSDWLEAPLVQAVVAS